MSQKNYSKQLIKIVLDLVWAQWNRLGLIGSVGANKYSTDIEAALLIFAHAVRYDARLYDGVWGWLNHYEDTVNNERLSTLIRKEESEWAARFLGAFFEKRSSSQWKTVIKQCRKMCSSSWKKLPLFAELQIGGELEKDSIFSKWGILYHASSPREKLQDQVQILKNNAQLRYRYLYGKNIRADILYLLSVSHNVKSKRELDFLTSVRLANMLLCNASTIHRIQGDLEKGGLLRSHKDLAYNPFITTWTIRDFEFLHAESDYDCAIVRWIGKITEKRPLGINNMLQAAMELAFSLQKIQNEAICKSRIIEFQDEFFPILNDHQVPVLCPYGAALVPLENHSVEQLISDIVDRLQLFYFMLCCTLMLRCSKCEKAFPSPIQGNISMLKKSLLTNNTIQCPHCSSSILTSKPDFFYYNSIGNITSGL